MIIPQRTNSTSLLFQTPATQAIVQSWNFHLYIGGEASKLINFSQCKTNSKLDLRLKKDKVSTVFKKPNWNARWRNIARHIHKAANLSAKWHALKIALWSLIFAPFLKTLAQIASMVHPRLLFLCLPLPDICMRSCSWFTDSNIISQTMNKTSALRKWNMIVNQK